MSQYERAVAELERAESWCRGARTLARLGDTRAIFPLVEAMNRPVEADKGCLYSALEKLGARQRARTLAESADASERAVAVRLMELFSGEEQLAPLERIAGTDSGASLRRAAAHTLGLQKQTAAWEATMVRLLEADDPQVRAEVIESLAMRYTESARQALRARLAREPDAVLRDRLSAVLQTQPP
jgi:HEAT repeat protein